MSNTVDFVSKVFDLIFYSTVSYLLSPKLHLCGRGTDKEYFSNHCFSAILQVSLLTFHRKLEFSLILALT